MNNVLNCINHTCPARQYCTRVKIGVTDYSPQYRKFDYEINRFGSFECAYFLGKPEDLLMVQISGIVGILKQPERKEINKEKFEKLKKRVERKIKRKNKL